jgi:hypothetical protein
LPGSFATLERLRPLPWRRPGNSGPWLVRFTNPFWLVCPKKPIRNPFFGEIFHLIPQNLCYSISVPDSSEAAVLFNEILEDYLDDPPSKVYLKRCQKCLDKPLSHTNDHFLTDTRAPSE